MRKKRSTATLIVVDDDTSIRRALETQLKIFGFNVLVFPSAQEMLSSDLPTINACLLLDVHMPGMSAIELTSRLAASQPHLPTILMSGSDDRWTRHIMREANPIANLFKPFDEETLLRAIRKALRKSLDPER